MKIKQGLLLWCIFCCLAGTVALAQTFYVDDDAPLDPGPGDTAVSDPAEDGSPEHPFDAIQEAIDVADPNDVVLIADGIYAGLGNWGIEILEKKITVMSKNGPTNCIIDGTGNPESFWYTSVVRLMGPEPHHYPPSGLLLEGFTITDGIYGITMFDATVRNCIIRDCGGGIYAYLYTDISNCTFYNNLEHAVYTKNSGGPSTGPWMKNCISWSNGEPDLERYPDGKGGVGGLMSVSYSILQSDWYHWHIPLHNCIVADPQFADPNNGDFHLKSQGGRFDPNELMWVLDSIISPAIDAGDPTDPIGHEPFPNGGYVNMGAYGGTAEASKSYFGTPPCETIVAGDINGDCIVNLYDFGFIARRWLDIF